MKKAFTLAEVLLVLLIIGILISLCMKAGKTSLESAYKLYYYRGVNTLNIAFNDFLKREKHITTQTDAETGVETVVGVQNPCADLLAHLDDLVGGDENSLGINYTCESTLPGAPDISVIKIDIPGVNNTRPEFEMIFSTGYNHTGDDRAFTGLSPALILTDAMLIQNGGVIPTYVDDGEVGRIVKDNTGNETYRPITAQTYQWSACASADNADANTVWGKYPAIYTTICPAGAEGTNASSRYKGKPIKFLKPKMLR